MLARQQCEAVIVGALTANEHRERRASFEANPSLSSSRRDAPLAGSRVAVMRWPACSARIIRTVRRSVVNGSVITSLAQHA